MVNDVSVLEYVSAWERSPFGGARLAPWHIVGSAEALILAAQKTLAPEYRMANGFAIHPSAIIEAGVVLKGSGIIGPRCFVAAGAYLRGGIYIAEDCIIGPGSELKTSFMFPGSKIAHLNFVGDSILGSNVNVEAGAMVANYRNEMDDKTIRIVLGQRTIDTGVTKFGALIGDHARIGANAVVAPGALIPPGTKVRRLQLIDQHPDA